MIAVIVAGGSGTRLWPLSVPSYPKQLLCIPGENASLLQATYGRAQQLTEKIYIVTESGLMPHMHAQLPELVEESYLVEPGRRGTANCIVAALARLSQAHGDDETVVFLSADHHIRDVQGFTYTFEHAAKVAAAERKIVLVGVEPDYPATGFGYIQKGGLFSDSDLVYAVECFEEKPDFATAQRYVKSGNYLWNCGYFVGTIATFVDSMQKHAPALHDAFEKLKQAEGEAYHQTYLALEPDSIDYALIEKVPNLLAMPAAFDWMDLGSFNDMHKAVESDEKGNHVHGPQIIVEEVENSFIQNHEDKPVAVIGLDNVVVVNTPGGIVVARKDLSQKVGEISKRFAAESAKASES